MTNVAVSLFSRQLLEGRELGSCVPGSQGPDSVLDTEGLHTHVTSRLYYSNAACHLAACSLTVQIREPQLSCCFLQDRGSPLPLCAPPDPAHIRFLMTRHRMQLLCFLIWNKEIIWGKCGSSRGSDVMTEEWEEPSNQQSVRWGSGRQGVKVLSQRRDCVLTAPCGQSPCFLPSQHLTWGGTRAHCVSIKRKTHIPRQGACAAPQGLTDPCWLAPAPTYRAPAPFYAC